MIGTRWSHDRSLYHFERTTPAAHRHIPFAPEKRRISFIAKFAIAFCVGMLIGVIHHGVKIAPLLADMVR